MVVCACIRWGPIEPYQAQHLPVTCHPYATHVSTHALPVSIHTKPVCLLLLLASIPLHTLVAITASTYALLVSKYTHILSRRRHCGRRRRPQCTVTAYAVVNTHTVSIYATPFTLYTLTLSRRRRCGRRRRPQCARSASTRQQRRCLRRQQGRVGVDQQPSWPHSPFWTCGGLRRGW